MFTLASGFYENYFIPPEVSLLVIGLDGAGKTTLLERLKVTDFKSVQRVRSGHRIAVKPVVKADDDKKKNCNSDDVSKLTKESNGTEENSGMSSAPSQNQNGASNGGSSSSTNMDLYAQNDRHKHFNNEIKVEQNGQANHNNTAQDADSLFNSDNDIVSDGDKDNLTTSTSRGTDSVTKSLLKCPAPRAYRDNRDDADINAVDEYHIDDNHHVNDQRRNNYLNEAKSAHDESSRSLASSCSEAGIVPLPTSDITSTPIAPHPPVVVKKHDVAKSNDEGIADHASSNGLTPATQSTSNTITNSNNNNQNNQSTAKNTKKKKIQYDKKPGAKMFPVHLIRPTVGMNLAKLEACKAKVRLMDLGGSAKMRNLWERYYKDIHGVAFVVDVSQHASVAKLMEARAFYRCMLDDESLKNIPILIFANKMDDRVENGDDEKSYDNDENVDPEKTKYNTESTSKQTSRDGNPPSSDDNGETLYDGGVLGDTSLLDVAELFLSPPRGSPTSNFNFKNVAMFAGSAKSGEGVRSAFEWLIQMGAFLVKAQRRASVH